MAERTLQYEDRMSDSDALMWHIERDPALRSTITSVWVLDRKPDMERLRDVTERAVRAIPRLRQIAVPDPLGLANPAWEADPNFDLRFHVRELGAPGKGTLRDLFKLAEPIAMQAFDRDRPLWEFHIVEGLEQGRAGVILKLHHSVSDGVGLVRMTESLVERSPEARPLEPLPPLPVETARGGARRSLEALRHELARRSVNRRALAGQAARGLLDFARDPGQTLRSAGELASSLGRMLAPISEPMSPIMHGRSLGVAFDAFSVPLDDMKRAAKAGGGSINDVFVTAVAGGFRLFHEHYGHSVDELRMTMPINVRSGEKGQKAGNQFAPVRFPVPVAEPDPVERMRIIRERVLEQRGERALPALDGVMGTLNRLPVAVSAPFVGSMLKAVDFTTSNVRGPRFPVYMSGARMLNMFPFGPSQGAANITAFSYDGQFQIGLNADSAAVVEPELLGECLRKGVAEVLAIA
jgi:WS/DGAT/MGAT family acyltransferase